MNEAAGGMGLPSLSLASGPAVSEAGGSGGQSTTGEFVFGRKKDWSDVAVSIAPYVLGGLVIWAVMFRR